MDITYCCRTDCQKIECPRHQFNAPFGDISIADLEKEGCFAGIPSDGTPIVRDVTKDMLHIKDPAEPGTITVNLNDIKSVESYLGTPCLICGDSVVVRALECSPKICDKCIEAVMHIRNTLNL